MKKTPADLIWLVPEAPIRIGVSTCLLGEEVRWDGNHKRDSFLVDTLGRYVEWIAVCPEVESGMPVPRPPIRLSRRNGALRLVDTNGPRDHTRTMKEWSRRRVREMERLDLCGYVLKKGSPSCGMERVKVWNDNGQSTRDGRGLFAEELMLAMPALPVEEEGRLTDSRLRENFIERVFCFHRLKAFFGDRWTLGGLVEFHTAHKLLLLSHHEQGYRRMGRLVAGGRGMSRSQLEKEYSEGFMEILKHTATTRRHTNVLQHMLGHFRKDLDPVSRRETAAVVEDYRRGMIPLVVPMTLLRHHALRLEVEYLTRQVYLQPHPMELMLRNHV